ncbi:PepSY domain-containing protein [Mangrovibrevibacter kandeliae]|uniref:PepSY domain-containing protein n=1 Tax=Mangrovibrevibacter kandeliae TaxID=2968473 RepID=UPI002119A950|nr:MULTISPECIES: PepSY domain-containing protein [unclassified Aurantimonas]MCQ8780633.1 PepSY domain-containing protein [Aurantimonas sp. CSK15Z-1]MCW4113414.1 PepSY domain-containing protein [Aurantimonas sp. MSK8Z-1]
MYKKTLIAGLALAVASTAVLPALAQDIVIGKDGVRLLDPRRDDHRGPPPPGRDRRPPREISENDAVRIARRQGMRDIDEVRRVRNIYRVDGFDRRGDDIRVDVDRYSGEVVAVR